MKIQEAWLEIRWGLLYVGAFSSFLTVATVTYPYFLSVAPIHYDEYVLLFFFLGAGASFLVGHLHGIFQNPTDVLKGNKPLLDEVRKIVREELDK
jgi:hypothetical protein